MDLNKAFVLGRLTADPQLRTTNNGNQVASFSVATNRVWNDKISGRREEVEFHNIVVWGQQADVASRFLAKGSLVLIEGRIQTRTWEDQQGQTRRTTEIVSERLQLPPRSMNPQGGGGNWGGGNNSGPYQSVGRFNQSNQASAPSAQFASRPQSPQPQQQQSSPQSSVNNLPTVDVGDVSDGVSVDNNQSSGKNYAEGKDSVTEGAVIEDEKGIKKEDLPF